MRKRNGSMAVLFVLAAGCGGGLSPQAYCEANQQLTCDKTFDCATTPQEQAALMQLYPTKADCLAAQQKTLSCSQVPEDKLCGGRGAAAWSPAAAETCINDVRALSCSQIMSGFMLPASCEISKFCP